MPPEPVAIAFANTRSSTHRDRIQTLTQWRAWVDAWPGLRPAGYAVDPDGLRALRATRDDLQLLLRAAASGHRPQPTRLSDLTPGSGLATGRTPFSCEPFRRRR
jgi:hypothetical protein